MRTDTHLGAHQVTAAVASMLEPAAKKARFGDAGQAAEPAVLVDVPPPAQGWCTAMQPARDARQLLDTTLIVGETRVEAHKDPRGTLYLENPQKSDHGPPPTDQVLMYFSPETTTTSTTCTLP